MNSEKSACPPCDDPRIAFFDEQAERWDDRRPASEDATSWRPWAIWPAP